MNKRYVILIYRDKYHIAPLVFTVSTNLKPEILAEDFRDLLQQISDDKEDWVGNTFYEMEIYTKEIEKLGWYVGIKGEGNVTFIIFKNFLDYLEYKEDLIIELRN